LRSPLAQKYFTFGTPTCILVVLSQCKGRQHLGAARIDLRRFFLLVCDLASMLYLLMAF
jgi:hypothetical protein